MGSISDYASLVAPILWEWRWYFVVYTFLTWNIAVIFWKYWWKAPSKIYIPAHPTPFGRWITALHMLFDSERLIERAYTMADGKPFAIPMTDRWIVFVSDQEQLKQLESASDSMLSMEEALHEAGWSLSCSSVMLSNLQVPPEHKGPKSESFRVQDGVLKNRVRLTIPNMSSDFQKRIRDSVALEVTNSMNSSCGQDLDDKHWQKVRLMPALLRIFTRVNLLAFFGEDEADRPGLYDDTINFFWACGAAFPFALLAPAFFMPIIGPLIMGFGITRHRVYRVVLRLTHHTLGQQNLSDKKSLAQRHIASWIAEMTKFQDVTVIAKTTFGLIFASAFSVPVLAVSCVYQLCRHTECLEKLRIEALEYQDASYDSMDKEMPYLDSFLKESARLSPAALFSAPRTIMSPYTLLDGSYIPAGNWLAIPQLPLMRDERIWPDARTFQGFRFVNKDGKSESRLSHSSYAFPFWGSIRHACPARFYVSFTMKLMLSHLLVDYEFKLADSTMRPLLSFGKIRVPNPFLMILVRKRIISARCNGD